MIEADQLHEQGIEAYRAGQRAQAVALLRQAVAQAPDNPHMRVNLGLALIESKQAAQALEHLARAVALAPELAIAHYQRGMALHALQQHAEALAAADTAHRLAPDNISVLNLRGNLWLKLGQVERAIADYRAAIAIEPGHALAHFNLGSALQSQWRHDEALAAYDAALAIAPDFVGALSNKGTLLRDLGRAHEAIAVYEAALQHAPEHASVRANLALALLQIGDYVRGWPLHEDRWHTDPWLRPWPGQRWNGEDALRDRTILVYGEQGLGDRLQFYRYLPLLAERGAELIVQAPEALRTLVQRLSGVTRVVLPDEDLPAADFHCALMSLPLAFGTALDTIPFAHQPYLHADAARVAYWQAVLGPQQRPRIGLVAQGNAKNPRDHMRSIPLRDLIERLPRNGGCDYVLLQNEVRPEDAALLHATPWLRTLHGQLRDFDDTAALCLSMDLVIGVDTSVAHLSGALHRPTWVLLQHGADWRWLQDRDDSPWYGSARLFRQSRRGDWGDVLDAVVQRLRAQYGTPQGGTPT